MTNYRGISLMSVAAKVFNRIRPFVDPTLRSNQAGFRPGRSCTQQIHILRRITEGFKDHQLPLVVSFIDFRKAFDSINRAVMFSILRHYGIPEAVVDAIQVMYVNSQSAVMVDGNISEPFAVSTGVLQGDVLAPFVFIIVVDYLLKEAINGLDSGVVTHPRRSRRFPAKLLNDLNFADDIALSWIHGGILCRRPQTTQGIGLDGFLEARKLWRSSYLPITTKTMLFNTTCITVLLYGCESWVISKDMENKITDFATSCYRIMLSIKRTDHVTNASIYTMTNTSPLVERVRTRQLKFLGHILRMPDDEPAKLYALYTPPHGKKRPGRQRTSFLTYVQRLLGDCDGMLQPDQIATLAQDRSKWRKLVVTCSAAEGWWRWHT